MLDWDAFELIAVAQRVFAALAGVALAADAVHGNGQRGVRFGRDRTQRHGASGKAFDDFFGGLHFVHRNGLGRVNLELEQATQGEVAAALVVDQLGVFLVGVPVVGARAVLQLGNRVGRPHMLFATGAPGVFATGIQRVSQHRVGTKSGPVGANGFFGNLKDAYALNPAWRAGEVLGHRLAGQADGLEQLRAAVTHIRAHAHLGHDLGQALAHGLDVVVNRFFCAQGAGQALAHGGEGFHRQVGMNGLSAVACQHRKVVHFARGAGFHHQASGGAQAAQHQVLVDGGQGQQRRYGDLRGVYGAVADDQDVVAAFDGVHRFSAQRSQLGLHALVAPGKRVSDVQRVAAELALGVALDVAQLGHVGEVEHGLRHFQTHGRVDLVDVEQVGLGADKRHQAHDNRLADRVDRRVGHLGEQLFEVVVQRLVFVRQDGQRAVVAHGAQGFLAVRGHGSDKELDVFLGKTKSLLAVKQTQVGGGGSAGRLADHVIELDAQVLNPLLVGLAVGQARLQLLVVDHAALFQINQEHLAGLQAPFANDFVLRHGQHAGLRAHDHQVVVGDAVARGAQAIAVQRGANLAAVGEHDAGRAVPGLEHGGVVFIESLAALVHGGVVFPGFWDHHHHGLADGVARHSEQFEAVIKGGSVGLVGKADGVELLQVGGQYGGRHHPFARLHPVVVALDGVDLAVVRHIAVGVGQRPLGEGVGRKPLVHQAQGRNAARVLQIVKIGAHLVGQQQALVNHGATGHARNVVFLAVLQIEVLNGGAGGLADHIQLALQRVLHDDVVTAANEHLADDGFFFPHCGRHGHVQVDWHIAPAQQYLAFGFDGALHLLFARHARGVLLGQKDHAHAVFASSREPDPVQGHLFAVQRVGQLNQDARTVPHEFVGAYRTPVVQVFENLERVGHDAVALLTPDMGHKTHTASIMLVAGRIQAVVLKVLDFGNGRHGALLKIYKGRKAYRTATKPPSNLIGVRFQLNLWKNQVSLIGDRVNFRCFIGKFRPAAGDSGYFTANGGRPAAVLLTRRGVIFCKSATNCGSPKAQPRRVASVKAACCTEAMPVCTKLA